MITEKSLLSFSKSFIILCKHSDFVSNISILTLNTCVLASKISNSVPELVGRSAQVMLNCVGMISVSSHARFIFKAARDLQEAKLAQDTSSMVAMAAKVAEKASNIFLICGNFMATLSCLIGKRPLALFMYRIMAPWGVAITIVSIALEGYHYVNNTQLLKRMEKISLSEEKEPKMSQVAKLFSTPSKILDKELKTMKVRLLIELDEDSQEAIESTMKKQGQANSIFELLQENCRSKKFFTEANLGLNALGYGSMMICRAYPDTLMQSAIYWGLSALYTTKLGWEKLAQANLHSKIESKSN